MSYISWIKTVFRNRTERHRREAGGASAYSPRTGQDITTLFDSYNGSYLQVATVHRCVKLLSESVAALPFRYLRRRDGIFVPDDGSALNYLLNVSPDMGVNAFDFMRRIVVEVLLDGNAYVVPVIDAATGDYSRLVLCTRHTVSHDTDNDTYTARDLKNAISGTFKASEIIHIKGQLTADGKDGLGVLSYARQTCATALAGNQETHKRFLSGGNMRGIVFNAGGTTRGFGDLQDEEMDRLAKSLDRRVNVEGENIVNIPGATDFRALSLSSADMQFLESRKFTNIEICRFFGVDPVFVFENTSSNYKSSEIANTAFLTNTLNPLLRSIEAEFMCKLVGPSLATRRRFSFDRRELYACDLITRADYQTKTIANGTYSPNDWRAIENRPRVEGGDQVFVSANLKALNETAANVIDNPQPDNEEKQ